jgi:hypothetical protein
MATTFQIERQTRFLFVGSGIGCVLFVIPSHVFGWHNFFVRLGLMAFGYLAGLCAGGSLHDRLYGNIDWDESTKQ